MTPPSNTAPRKGPSTPHPNPDIIRGAKNNDLSEVIAALDADKNDITKTDFIFGLSALHYAAAKGNIAMVKFLLYQEGVDIAIKDRWNRDPLDVAVLSGHEECINALFRFRAGVDLDDPDKPFVRPGVE